MNIGRLSTMKPIFGTLAYILALSACSGGGSTPAARSSQSQSAVALSIHIPETTTSSNKRVPKYVSPSTQGMQIADGVHGSGVTSFTTNVDLSSSSASCTAATGGRTCSVSVPAPGASDDFTFTTYDATPSSANFGQATHELGTATVTATIVAGASNVVSVALGGVPMSLKLLVPYGSFYGNAPLTFNLGMQALDADGNIILAGFNTASNGANSETDTYASSISVSLAETNPNGGGDMKLSLNGGAAATQVTVTKTSDSIKATYDGLAPSNYSVSFSATALSVSPNPPASVAVPMFMTAAGAGVFVNGALPSASFQVPTQIETFTLTEAGFTGVYSAQSANLGSANCPTGSYSLDTSQLQATGTFTVTSALNATANAGCTLSVSDGRTTNVTLSLTNAADPILYVPDQATIAIDMYDSITYASVGSFSVHNGNATGGNGYRPVTAALDKVFGRVWVGFDNIPPVGINSIPTGLVQAYQTQTGNSLISSANLQFGSHVEGIAVTTAVNSTLYVNLTGNSTVDIYNVATNTPSANGSIVSNPSPPSAPLSEGMFYDNTSSLLYMAGDTASGQNFAEAYTAANSLNAASTIPQPNPRTDLSFAVAVDDAHKLIYVTNTATNAVDIFSFASAITQVGTIAAPGGGATILGVLLDAHGKLFVSYSSEILVYDTTNNNALLHTIVTSARAYGMAIDPGT